AMAFAGLDLAVQAIDADPATAAVATVNLRHFPEATVRAGLAETVTLPSGPGARHTGVWVDPARRVTGVADSRGRTTRVFSLDAISPSWTQVQQWAARVPAAGAKLSPAFAHHAIPAGAEAEWVSWRGEVLECVVWFGSLARRPGRVASVCRRDRLPVSVAEADAHGGDATLGRVSQVGPYLYEADRAVVRAGLTGALVRVLDGAELDTGVGYVSADRPVEVGYARRYAVLEAMPLNVKALRTWARSRGIGRLTIKKRGVTLDPDLLRRQLRLAGEASATVVLTRVAGGQVVVVVEPR
ncbi:MAG TPA: hypothetical protein VHM65_08320, partial [Candidatus Lustribacter sp.]|nr:hypothetical protein [Candidatus Lustribacter sp.]